jgi:hypothetical protein
MSAQARFAPSPECTGCRQIFKNEPARSFGFEARRYPALTNGVRRQFCCGAGGHDVLVLVVLGRRRRRTSARAPRRWRRQGRSRLLRRKEKVVAGLAQPRPAGPKAGLDAPWIEQIGAAEPHRVRRAGFTLFGGSLIFLGETGGWDHEEKCRCGETAASSRRRHYDSCSVAGIPGRGSGDKSASTNWQSHRRGSPAKIAWTVASKLGCNPAHEPQSRVRLAL